MGGCMLSARCQCACACVPVNLCACVLVCWVHVSVLGLVTICTLEECCMWGDTAFCAVMIFHMSALPTITSGCYHTVATHEHQSCVSKAHA